jgi:hypothetical protein
MDALDVLTGGLVAATGVLAWFTRELASRALEARDEAILTRQEMEASRDLSVTPVLTFDPHLIGGLHGTILIRNVGQGTAFDVRLNVDYKGADFRTEWRESSIVPGESHQLMFPEPFFERTVEKVAQRRLVVHVTGAMRDVYGRERPIDQELDVAGWAKAVGEAKERVKGRRKIPGVDVD